MKCFLFILLVLLIGCVEYPEHTEIVTEPSDDSFADLTFTMVDCDKDDCPKELASFSAVVPRILSLSSLIDGEMETFSIDVSKDSRCLDAEEMKILRWLYKFWAMPYSEREKYRN